MSRIWTIVVFLVWSIPAFSMPQFLQAFRADPFRNPAIDGCGTCHVSPQGGGPRNPFGLAFMANGERITPLFRAQFPDHFIYPLSRVNDRLTIHFSDPDKKQIVTETDGMRSLVDVAATTSEIPVDPYAREGVFFGSNIVNLPDGKPLKAGEVDFLIGHRFLQDVDSAGPGALAGFDSPAWITFGGRVGLTDRISVGAQRSNFFRSLE